MFAINPLSLLLAFSLFKAAPYSLISYFHPEIINATVSRNIGADNLASTIIQFNLLYGLFIACLVFTLWATSSFSAQRRLIQKALQWGAQFKSSTIQFHVMLLLAIVLFFLKWHAIGGISGTVFGGELDRATAAAGISYIVAPADIALAFASLFAMNRYQAQRSRFALLTFAAVFAFAAISFSLFGGRKALLQHAIISLAFWNLFGGSIRIMSIRYMAVAALGGIYFVSLLEFRLSEAGRNMFSDNLGLSAFSGLSHFFANFSYNDTYYFLLDHFASEAPYMGATFADLMYSALPSSYFPGKPPVDEGLYVRSLAEGMYPKPPVPAYSFSGIGSWPPETFGNFVMNFGSNFIWVAGVLLALVVFFGINVLRRLRVGILPCYFIFHSALNFQISNLRIVNALTLIIFGAILLAVVKIVAGLFTLRPRQI